MLDMASLKYTFTDPVIRKNHAHTIIFYVWMSQKSFFFTGFFLYLKNFMKGYLCLLPTNAVSLYNNRYFLCRMFF